MIEAKTSELPECPECGSDDWSVLAKRGRLVRLACEMCGNAFTVDADEVEEAE